MSNRTNTVSWLDHLAVLTPPERHFLVGAGSGAEPWVSYLIDREAPNVTLLEADSQKISTLKRSISKQSNWEIRNEVVAPQEGPVTFHYASLPTESGLVMSEELRSLWPNIESVRSEERNAITLDNLLANNDKPNVWLWLDCFPALPILEGLNRSIGSIQVLVARILLDLESLPEHPASLPPLEAHLRRSGFRPISVEAGKHPGIGYAIFIRNVWATAARLRRQITSLHAELELAKEELQIEKNSQAKPKNTEPTDEINTPEKPPAPTVDAESMNFYVNLPATSDGSPTPFVLLDSKSIPRSGIHYLKNTLAALWGKHFSFCEWYREVGCCKQHPCALRGFANHAQQTGEFRLRLIKSHDFPLNDPVLATSPHIQRLVLIRDPLFVLTSWFELEQLTLHSKLLAKNGIEMAKIWLSHEKEVLNSAYQILEDAFQPPASGNLQTWLSEKSDYLLSFLNRWVEPELIKKDPHTHLISYHHINQFILQLTESYRDRLPAPVLKATEEFAARGKDKFASRGDPFSTKTEAVSQYLKENSAEFLKFADQVHSKCPMKVQEMLKP
jgi:hypothetical protein